MKCGRVCLFCFCMQKLGRGDLQADVTAVRLGWPESFPLGCLAWMNRALLVTSTPLVWGSASKSIDSIFWFHWLHPMKHIPDRGLMGLTYRQLVLDYLC